MKSITVSPAYAGKAFAGTREAWAEKITAALFPMLVAEGIAPVGDHRQIRIALAPLPAKTLGLCYPSSKSTTGDVNLITLSTDQGEPIELVHTIMHEMMHAFDDCRSGHRNRWLRWANQIGIVARGHIRGPIAERMVQTALAEVGFPTAHVITVRKVQKPKSSQVRYECPGCRLHVHMPLKSADDGFEVACLRCKALMVRRMEAI